MKTQGAASKATLIDGTSGTARTYDAKTTPHMFVIDPSGKLVYNGAIDGQALDQRLRRADREQLRARRADRGDVGQARHGRDAASDARQPGRGCFGAQRDLGARRSTFPVTSCLCELGIECAQAWSDSGNSVGPGCHEDSHTSFSALLAGAAIVVALMTSMARLISLNSLLTNPSIEGGLSGECPVSWTCTNVGVTTPVP